MGKKRKTRPGVYLYFDKFEPIRDMLSFEDKGRIMQAMVDYAQNGIIPEFDGTLKMVWSYIKPGIDADGIRWRESVVRNTYNSYKAVEKKASRTPKDFEDWLIMKGIDTEGNPLVPGGTDGYPNIEPSLKINSYSTLNTKPTREGAGEEKPDPNDFNAKKNAAIELLSNYPG